MKNPNAIAAWVSTHIVIGAQAIAQSYFHAKLPAYWQTEIAADTATVVLLIGRDGLSGAARRALQAVKRLWSGSGSAEAAAAK